MTAGVQKPQEVKFYDQRILQGITPDEGWSFLVPIGAGLGSIADMRQGTGPSERIGRSIRVVGIVLRVEVECQGFDPDPPPGYRPSSVPYTVDLLWDLRPAGPPNVDPGLIYDEANYINAPQSAVPTVINLSRFKFIKRVERSDMSPTKLFSMVNMNIQCNKVIEFKDASTDYQSVTVQPNLVISSAAGLACSGTVRYLYVDA